MKIILTCEHGGNKIPKKFAKYFNSRGALLKTHRGLDIGALGVARMFSKKLGAPLVAATTSRLLVDLNRSNGHSGQFSEITKKLSPLEKDFILKNYYFPHHVRVQSLVQSFIEDGVIHIGVHSFTPILNGVKRNADVGILFDPKSKLEAKFAVALKDQLNKLAPDVKVRMNYPYKGTSDGLTKMLRRAFTKNYIGIELEMNQSLFSKKTKLAAQLLSAISKTKDLM